MMKSFAYSNGALFAEGVLLADIADRYGTPCFVYSRAAIEQQWKKFNQALPGNNHLICYAVKANSNLAVLDLLARMGSGFDIVSVGELERVICAGGDASRVVFSGVGKKTAEMRRALEVGIKCFNVESHSELVRLNQVASDLNLKAPVSLRVNPDVDAETHPYIATGLRDNKFGIAYDDAEAIYESAASMDNLEITGIDCHIGSQITGVQPFTDALQRLKELINKLDKKGIALQHIDIGGGLGICYQDETPPTIEEYIENVVDIFADTDLEIILEPGRSIVGNAGLLLTRVEYLKSNQGKNFAIVDGAMNDLLRPALYSAWHDILPLKEHQKNSGEIYDVVGPVCETGDFLGRDRKLNIEEGDLLAVGSAGAYGFSMSSTYNSRPRACEIMVDGDQVYEIRKRESVDDLMAGESLLP